jgi:hypothetical protein
LEQPTIRKIRLEKDFEKIRNAEMGICGEEKCGLLQPLLQD